MRTQCRPLPTSVLLVGSLAVLLAGCGGSTSGRDHGVSDRTAKDGHSSPDLASSDARAIDRAPGHDTSRSDGGANVDSKTFDASKKQDVPVSPDKSGGTSCDQILACVELCSSSSCVTACVQQGTAAGQQRFVTLTTCLNTASSGKCGSSCATPASSLCQSCLTAACQAELKACGVPITVSDGGVSWPDGAPWPDGGPPKDSGGPLSCSDILDCGLSCVDPACEAKCVQQGSPSAQAQFAALAKCTQTALGGTCASACSNPSSSACDQCMTTACGNELLACMGP